MAYKIIVRKNYKDNRRYWKPGDLLEDQNGNHLAFDNIDDTVAYIREHAGDAAYNDKVLDFWPDISETTR